MSQNNALALALNNLQLAPNAGALAAFIGDDDLSSGVSAGYPVMSIRGAKWRISQNGEERPIYIPGTTDLAPAVRVVLLRANRAVSKTFYAGAYVEGADTAPTCQSGDGVRPDTDSEQPQSATCATCKHNEWGSKISPAGKKIKACGDVRRMAVLPAEDLEFPASLLRIPGASLGDLAAYGQTLRRAGVNYAAVVTKLSFDPSASFPKIMFALERALTAEEVESVAAQIADPAIDDVLGLTSPRAAAPAPQEQAAPVVATPAEPVAQAPVAQAQAAPVAAPVAAPRARRTAAAPAPVAQAQAAQAPASNVVQMPAAQAAAVATGTSVADDIEAELAALSL